MSESISPPAKLTLYMLMKQDGMLLTQSMSAQTPNIGNGIFWKLEDAEMHRTFEYTKLPSGMTTQFHIFEVTIPNPGAK